MKKSAKQRAYDFYHENLEREREKRRLRARNFREKQTLQSLYNNAKDRCMRRGIEFSITVEDLVVPPVCPVFKTEFVRKTPYAMSIDRINPAKGYIPGNVQIISRKANLMKNDATYDELKAFAKWIKKNSRLAG